MVMTVRSKVVNIGNSRGIRIPRALLEQAGLTDEVEMTIEDDCLIIRSAHQPRLGWDVQFAGMAENGEDQLIEGHLPTRWDAEEWKW